MKKIISLALIGVISLSMLASCGKSNATLEDLSAAVEKSAALEYVDADVSMKVDIKMSGLTVNTDIAGNTKLSKADGKTVTLSDMTTTTGEEEIKTVLYYADGYMYTDYAGMKTKTELSEAEAIESASAEFPAFDLNDENVTEFTTEDVDGGVKFNISFNDENVKDALSNLLGNYSEDSAENFEGMEISNTSAYYIVDKNNYCSEYNVNFDMSMNDETLGAYSTSMDITVKYNNIGEKFEITAPADLDEYVED